MRVGLAAALFNAMLLAPAFVLSPAQASVHGWWFVALVSVFACSEAAHARGLDVSTGRASWGPAATGAVLLVVFATALVTASAVTSTWIAVVGALAMLGGIALRRAAMLALGPAFLSELRPLTRRDRVRHGPYAWLEHPSEVGLLLIASGAVLVLGSVAAAIVVALVLAPLVVVRMRRESAALRDSA